MRWKEITPKVTETRQPYSKDHVIRRIADGYNEHKQSQAPASDLCYRYVGRLISRNEKEFKESPDDVQIKLYKSKKSQYYFHASVVVNNQEYDGLKDDEREQTFKNVDIGAAEVEFVPMAEMWELLDPYILKNK